MPSGAPCKSKTSSSSLERSSSESGALSVDHTMSPKMSQHSWTSVSETPSAEDRNRATSGGSSPGAIAVPDEQCQDRRSLRLRESRKKRVVDENERALRTRGCCSKRRMTASSDAMWDMIVGRGRERGEAESQGNNPSYIPSSVADADLTMGQRLESEGLRTFGWDTGLGTLGQKNSNNGHRVEPRNGARSPRVARC